MVKRACATEKLSISMVLLCPHRKKKKKIVVASITGLETWKYYSLLLQQGIVFCHHKATGISQRIILSYEMHGHNDQRTEIHTRAPWGLGREIICLCLQYIVKSLMPPPWYSTNAFEQNELNHLLFHTHFFYSYGNYILQYWCLGLPAGTNCYAVLSPS